MLKRELIKNRYKIECDNMAEFWDYISRPQLSKAKVSTAIGEGSAEYLGTKTWDEAMNLSRYGWKEGLQKMRPYLASLEKAIMSKVHDERTMAYDVTGECPDVAAFVQGIPEHMISYQSVAGRGKVVKIVYNAATSSGVATSVQFRRGAVACALADAIEKAGMRAEIIVGVSAGRKITRDLLCMIKRADEPLNLERLAYFFGNASFERRLEYRSMEVETDKAIRQGMMGEDETSYGNVRDFDPADRGDIYFGGMSYAEPEMRDDETAIAYAIKKLKEVGVEIAEA
jgi:hypothetical protein